MSRSVVVTGAAGFIGSHLARAIMERGDRVVGVDNFDPFYDRAAKAANVDALERAAAPGRLEVVEADIRDGAGMADLFSRVQPACVFHIAAMAGVRPSIADPVKYAEVNIGGLVSVLEAARGCGCDRVVFASSSSVYGNNRKVPFAEDDPVDEPISPYAATKKSGELICHTYSHLHGLRIASLRLFTVYGPAQRPDLAIATFMARLARNEDIPMYGDGRTSRDYTYIDDIVAGVLAAADRLGDAPPGFNRVYNLGGSQPVALADMVQRIGCVVGIEPRVRHLPMQPGDVMHTYADLTRSREELGFDPQTSFDDGLARQWAWMRQSAAAIG